MGLKGYEFDTQVNDSLKAAAHHSYVVKEDPARGK